MYKQIVDRIIIAVQTDFEEGGYDPQTLQDLRKVRPPYARSLAAGTHYSVHTRLLHQILFFFMHLPFCLQRLWHGGWPEERALTHGLPGRIAPFEPKGERGQKGLQRKSRKRGWPVFHTILYWLVAAGNFRRTAPPGPAVVGARHLLARQSDDWLSLTPQHICFYIWCRARLGMLRFEIVLTVIPTCRPGKRI